MAQKTLSKEAVSRARSRLEPELGRVNLLRFDTVVALLDARGQANLGAVIEQLYPDQQRASALSNYRQFRRLLQVGAASAGIKLSLETDGKTRSEPETRTCWFEGDDGAIEAVTRFVKAEVLDAERTGQDVMELVDPEGPPVVRFFVSYAHEDATDVANLLKPLRTLLNVASNYRFEHWMDKAILPGEHWRKEIERALNDCHFGLLFVSPAFLNSAYISEHELPQFVARDNDDSGVRKYALPVALHRFPLDGSINLKGLEQHQIFLDAKGRTFEERSTDKTRRDFAQELFARLVKAVGKQLAVASKPPEAKARSGRDRQEGALESHLRAAVADGEDPACFVRTRGLVGSLDKLDEDTETTQEAPRADAIEYLGKWINDPDAPPYCALLGEVGMGKTTTCRAFAGYLLQQREHNPAIALPIYLDLRLLGERAKSEPVLSDILTQVLARSWKGGHVDHAVQAQELIRLVQEEGALVIFDGLDEVLVHLTPAQGQHFARELFRILPPANKRQAKSDAIRRGRLLISCRTHYFRTLRDQKTFLTAEGRDGIRHEDYRALVLLPFNEDQILSYLTETLPDEDPERVMEVIRSVHNLSEIAERPYTLSLIAKHFHQIERWNLEGRKVTGLMLYRHMVLSWLERDTGKHQLTPDHKQALMEYFAAALWRSGKRLWRVGEVEQWLIDFLEANPHIAAHYVGANRELLKEDLRTATFLVREGEDGFRFAHTSLLEFFLAGFLRRALVHGDEAALELPSVSRETLHFLGQWLEDDDKLPTALAMLARIRDTYRPQASELAFEYMLYAQTHALPAPSLSGFQLPGADLSDRAFTAEGSDGFLNLTSVNLTGATLRRTRWQGVNLESAVFVDARLAQAEFLDCRLVGSRWAGADLTAAVFRRCNATAADFGASICRSTHWVDCALAEVRGLPDAHRAAYYAGNRGHSAAPVMHFLKRAAKPWIFPSRLRVFGISWSPVGDRLLSAGHDGTLRVWDAASGDCLHTLRGHEGSVASCAWSPVGDRLLSAGQDGTLRVWDAASGDCLRTLRGHEGGGASCAWSPVGDRLLSAGQDGTLRVWDAASGECLHTLRGHEDWVTSCAWSPAGDRLLSAGVDGTLRMWDAASGDCLRTLHGHEEWVTSCAWSPAGDRLLSAGQDGTLRMWDAASGDCLRILRRHESGVASCAWSPAGDRLLSAGDDDSLRVWDVGSGDCLQVLHGHEWGGLTCTWSPVGDRLLSAGGDDTLRVWDVASGDCLKILHGHEGAVRSCAWSPAGDRLLSVGGDYTLRVWDVASGDCLRALRGHEGPVQTCAWSRLGDRLLSAGVDGTLRVWDAASGDCLRVLRGLAFRVRSCAWSPAGDQLLSAEGDGKLRVWDAASGDCLHTLRGHEDMVTSCAWSPAGDRLLSAGGDGTLRVWDAASGDCLRILRRHEGGVASCAWSPAGDRLLSAGDDGTLRVWDAASGDCLHTLRGHEGWVRACAWSPAGDRLLSAGDDGTLRVWDSASGDCLHTLRGHENGETSCAWSPAGDRLLSAGDDGTLRVWDATTGEALPLLRYHLDDDAWCVLDMADGRVQSCGSDAWRWLRWEYQHPETGERELLPAEIFGPLPVLPGR